MEELKSCIDEGMQIKTKGQPSFSKMNTSAHKEGISLEVSFDFLKFLDWQYELDCLLACPLMLALRGE